MLVLAILYVKDIEIKTENTCKYLLKFGILFLQNFELMYCEIRLFCCYIW
jgi:hypothetical protein